MGLVMMTTLGSLMTAMAMAEVNIQPKVTWQPTWNVRLHLFVPDLIWNNILGHTFFLVQWVSDKVNQHDYRYDILIDLRAAEEGEGSWRKLCCLKLPIREPIT